MDKQWYVVNTYSGHENKVKEKLEMRAESMDMKDFIFRVVIPEEKIVEVKDGVTKERVKKINETVPIMELIPPRVNKASTLALPVFETNPFSINPATLLTWVLGFSIKIIPTVTVMLNSNVATAGTFMIEHTNNSAIGKMAHQEMKKWLFKTFNVVSILPRLSVEPALPKIV